MIAFAYKKVFLGDTISCVLCGLVHHVQKGNMPTNWRGLHFESANGHEKIFYVCPAHVPPMGDHAGFERMIDQVCARLGLDRNDVEGTMQDE